MNTEFAGNRNSLSQADTVSTVPCFIDNYMVREPISKTKNGKTAGMSLVVSEMVKAAREEGGDMITYLINQIITYLSL